VLVVVGVAGVAAIVADFVCADAVAVPPEPHVAKASPERLSTHTRKANRVPILSQIRLRRALSP
jgi:hypothetical protein